MASPYDPQFAAIRSRVTYYAAKYGIPADIAIRQIWQESRFDPNARSSEGAAGIAQFMPATAQRFGVKVNDVESSLDGWGRYMAAMISKFNGRIDIALAGYNSGEKRNEYMAAAREGRSINWNILPARVKTETQSYVNSIMAGLSVSAGTAAGISGLAIAAGALILLLFITE